MVKNFSQYNRREKNILLFGLVAACIGIYFFILEPLQKKTKEAEKITETRLSQLTEMHLMAQTLYNEKLDNQPIEDLLKGKLANETSEGSFRAIKTKALNHEGAKNLVKQLAVQGKVTIRVIDENTSEVLFWEKQ